MRTIEFTEEDLAPENINKTALSLEGVLSQIHNEYVDLNQKETARQAAILDGVLHD